MRYIFTCIIIGCFSISNAQTVNLEWAKAFSGTRYEEGNSIAVDAAGSLYSTGIFEGTVDFDPGPGIYNITSSGSIDIFISKQDAAGNFIWAKNIGGSSSEYGKSIAIDQTGNVYITGGFLGTVDFDPGPNTYNLTSTSVPAGGYNIFVCKLNGSGNFVWAKNLGGGGSENFGNSIFVDAANNVCVTGFFGGTVDFDPGPGNYNLISVGGYDIFIAKLDASGNLIWAKSMGGSSDDRGYSIKMDVSGNIYAAGFFHFTVDFDPGPANYSLTSPGNYATFIIKLNNSGNLVWAKSMGGVGSVVCNSIVTDPGNNVFLTGHFSGTADFDPGPGTFNLTPAGGSDIDIYVAKLDAAGNFAWAKNMGGTSGENSNSIARDAPGNLYITGYFRGTSDFDPGPGISNLTSVSNVDIFISKLDAAGNFAWAKNMGGISSMPLGTFNLGNAIVADAAANVYAIGSFQGAGDFDPGPGTFNLTSASSSTDVFIVKFNQVIPGTTTLVTSSINPSTVAQSVTFTATVTAASGTPAGTVSFYDGTTLLGTGTLTGNTATFSTSTLTAGSHNITVVYAGNTSHATSTSPVLIQVVSSPPNTSTNTEWVWMKGDNSNDSKGIYGTQGVSISANNPGARYAALSWNDASGYLWLFGGVGYDAVNNNYLNDLWKYNIAANQWTWVKGDAITSTAGKPGIYGTQGIAAPANNPGPRNQAVSWKDAWGNQWLFGGTGYDANGNFGVLNDLWKYDPNTNQWTWIKGDNIRMQAAIYGVLGTPSSVNKPGARHSAVSWTDQAGNFWLFGGFGYVGHTNDVYALNDLWKYNPATNQWTWVKGDNTGNNIGVYGIQGTPATANNPGAKWDAASWVDASGNLWLFGGMGLFASNLNGGYYNDLWKYNPATNQWTWMKGDNTVNGLGIYGTQGIYAQTNNPGAREGSITWTDISGSLWLLGGSVLTAGNNKGYMNDLWKYDPATNQWAWMRGDNNPNNVGVYGTIGISLPTNKPGGREGSVSWIDLSGNFWLFGGEGLAASTNNTGNRTLNDLWKLGVATIPGLTNSTITSSINPSTVAQSVTFTATVTAASGTPAGTVSFYDGTTLLGTGTLTGNTATFSTSTLTSGSHNITAVYNGNANYSSSTSSILTQVVTVPVVTTTTSLVSSLNPSTVSQNVTFTATVTAASGTPTGIVSFYDGTTLLGTGTLTGNTATSSTSTLTAGSHNITAVYNGNVNYSSSTSSVLTQVVTIPIVTTTTSLASSLNPSTVGQGVIFTATVSAASGTPTGTVSFYDGTTLLGTGTITGNTAIFSTSSLTAGSHNITAVFSSGAASHSSSTSAVLIQFVNAVTGAIPTTTSVISSGNFTAARQNVTFTATVTATSGIPTGTISFFDGPTLVATSALSANTATYSTSALVIGWHTITAKYNGNINYLPSTSSVSHTVTTITPAKLLHLYPNPIIGNTIAFQLNMEHGKYAVSLTTAIGQTILTKTIQHNGGSVIHTIELPQGVSAGIYGLTITGTGIIFIRKVIKY